MGAHTGFLWEGASCFFVFWRGAEKTAQRTVIKFA